MVRSRLKITPSTAVSLSVLGSFLTILVVAAGSLFGYFQQYATTEMVAKEVAGIHSRLDRIETRINRRFDNYYPNSNSCNFTYRYYPSSCFFTTYYQTTHNRTRRYQVRRATHN